MTKAELIKALENYPDDEEVLIDCSPLYDGKGTYFDIEDICTIVPARILIGTYHYNSGYYNTNIY